MNYNQIRANNQMEKGFISRAYNEKLILGKFTYSRKYWKISHLIGESARIVCRPITKNSIKGKSFLELKFIVNSGKPVSTISKNICYITEGKKEQVARIALYSQ